MPDGSPDITGLLQQWGAGDGSARDEVISLVYNQLRAIAQNQMRRERASHTLQPTALVNELYLQLARQHGSQWKDRRHFFAFAAMLMRRILIDYAKRTRSEKRCGGLERVALSEETPWLGTSQEEILSLDAALQSLEKSDPRKVRVIELRVMLGCTAEETADLLELSKNTVDREWAIARAWLYRELTRSKTPGVSA